MSNVIPETKDEQDQAYAPHESIPGYNRNSDGLDDHPVGSGDSSGTDPFDANAAETAAATGGANPNQSLGDSENDPNAPPGGWHNGVVPGGNRGEKSGFLARISKNRKWLIGAGIGAGGVSIPLIILSLLPLKLEMMIQNVTGLASKVPEYAIQQRTEYIITRALATRMLGLANGASEADSALVFCKGGGIACSLFSTYSTNYFQDKLGISIDNVKAQGVTSLGGKASSWKVTVPVGNESVDGLAKQVDGLTKEITLKSNSEMKKFIAAEVEKSHGSTMIDRFLARKLLMKKFGVTTWRGPPIVEKAANSAKTALTNMKTSILKNTVGKIAPRLTTYMTCLTDAQVCANLRESLATGNKPTIPNPDDDPSLKKGTPAYDQAKARYTAQGLVADSGAVTADEAATGILQKIITKKVLAVAGGVGAAVGVLDLGFNVIHSISTGKLSEIQYDIASQVYTGFSTDVQTAWEKVKAGDSDIDTLAAYNSLFDNNPTANGTVSAAATLDNGVDSSPLYQAESGQAVDTSKGLTVPCDSPNGKVNTKLAPGQLICDDQKAVRDFAPYFNTDPTGMALKNVADVWVGSVGAALKLGGDVVGAIINAIPGFQQATSALGSLFAGSITGLEGWITSLIFHTPNVGPSASGSDNYVGLSGGIRITQNALMEEGVDADGTAMGGGGTPLSTTQLAVIDQQQKQADKAYFDSQPILARIFDTSLTGSFAQQFISRIPTSVSSVASLPISSFMQLFTGASAATDSATLNPFVLPLYGYSADSSALTADPSTYTDASCAASAAARADPKNHAVIGNNLVATYNVADPCALEKMVVGEQAAENNLTDNKYAFKPITGTSSSTTAQTSLAKPAQTSPKGNGWTLSRGVDYSSTACAAGTQDVGMYTNPTLKFTVRLCYVNSFPTSAGSNINGSLDAVVASVISKNVVDMFAAAKADGLSLGISDGMRSPAHPYYTVNSQHSAGVAIDIGSPRGGQTVCFVSGVGGAGALSTANATACRKRTDNDGAVVRWLDAHAATYGFQNLKSEPWHWSMGES
jgi:hypothetical protein